MSKSDLERTFDFQLRVLGLPEPKAEYRFHPTRKWRFDRCWPALQLAVEIEGFGHHKLSRFVGDVAKYNEAVRLGWSVLRLTTRMVADGTGVALVEQVIRDRQKS